MPKKRLDLLLVDRGLAETRSRAQALIMAGAVIVDGQRVDKAGVAFDESSEIRLKSEQLPYVSRGGLKLAHALDEFGIDPAGKVCVDVGASTGGFTDCLLQRGAAKVWAIDTGTNQLHYSLRTDERVVSLERMNARHIDPAVITGPVDILVADVSFISLRLVIPPLLPALASGARLVLLVKPQFEAGRDKVGKGGLVRDESVREEVLAGLRGFFEEAGLIFDGRRRSPILGQKGNVEYLIVLTWPGPS